MVQPYAARAVMMLEGRRTVLPATTAAVTAAARIHISPARGSRDRRRGHRRRQQHGHDRRRDDSRFPEQIENRTPVLVFETVNRLAHERLR